MTKHTETPWEIVDQGKLAGIAIAQTKDASPPDYIAFIYGINGSVSRISEKQQKANAEFIVRAVNSYDDMLEVVEAFRDIEYSTDDQNYSAVSKALDLANAAIAKAKGKL